MTATKYILAIAGAGLTVGAGVIASTILAESVKAKKDKTKDEEEALRITEELNEFFKDLGIKSDTVNEENMQNCIYFEDKEKAERFLCKLKLFIQENYPKAGEEKWY